MTIDLFTMQLATTTVTIVAGVMFILDTFLRRTDAAGRVWAVAFVAGILGSVAYAVWALEPAAWWAVALGNAAVALSPGLLWAGCRAYNGRRDLVWVALVGAVLVGLAAIVERSREDGWAGGAAMFIAIAVFAALGAAESLRAPMRENWTARGLTVMFLFVAAYYALRAAAFVVAGPDDPWFRAFLGTEAAGFVLISLIIVSVISMVVLQSERVPRPIAARAAELYLPGDVLAPVAFRRIVEDWLDRSAFHDEQLVFSVVRLDGLGPINTAFGRSAGAAFVDRFTADVRRHTAPNSAVGWLSEGELAIVAPFARLDDARRNALAMQGGLRERPIEGVQGLRMSASIGLAGSDAFGHDYDRLLTAASEAVDQAAASGGDVVVGADTASA
ncbi:diguanylate cyclase domain-containing protein [Agromyces sp. LHK192]|uniref:diguanylate cyclase domain-containing protein n=1 Tax=Agromyces sp. LHK192 TaxID=2498704 RepID=UPI000FDC9620|nr:diguanylate cyclase [Agromyces sp. LHK192]